MNRILASLVVAGCALASACGKNQDAALPAPPATSAKTEGFRENPEFGGVKGVSAEAEGVGPTPSVAVLRALDQAIARVNGRRVASGTAAVGGGTVINVSGLGSAQVNGDGYVDAVVSASNGAIRSFSVLSQEEVERVDAEYAFKGQANSGGWFGDSIEVGVQQRNVSRYWKVKVRAEVAKFVGPRDDGRPKLVIAAPRTRSASYPVGDGVVASHEVAEEIRARLSDVLTQTGRFQVLDREFDDEMQGEVDFINSGNARSEEAARLGQRLATDLILVPTVERFEYPKSSRKLRLSGRELTSYSGGGRITLRLINATTGEVVLSESFDHQLPATGPSTLSRSIDGRGMAAEMMESLSGRMSKAVVNEIFPVSVIALSGSQVVLSQGGKSVSRGERYDAVLLGEELVDPQTGRSLGRMESPCCVIRIERVADKTAYGSIEGDVPSQLSAFRPGMLELRGLSDSAMLGSAESPDDHPDREAALSGKPASPRSGSTRTAKADEGSTPAGDENW